jgi:hypothetical protein
MWVRATREKDLAYLRDVISLLTNLTGTTWLPALVLAVTDTMAFFTAEEASDDRLNRSHLLIRTSASGVTKFAAVVAFWHTAVKRNAGVSKTSEILCGGFRPLVDKTRAGGVRGGEVAHSVLLVNIALDVDNGPSLTDVLLHGNQIDAEAPLAELLLQLGVSVIWAGLAENGYSFLEVCDVTILAGWSEQSPGLVFGLVGEFGIVDQFWVLAVQSNVTWSMSHCGGSGWRCELTILAAVLALIDTIWAILTHVTFFLTSTTSASELAWIGTVGLILREESVEEVV